MRIRYLTAGESHGKALVSIIEGIPAGLKLDRSFMNGELSRRMKGYGRGGRMKIERDRVEILSGIRKGKTLGSPIALLVKNRDFKIENLRAVNCPRPGHADLAGALKFGERDMRNILERASARETASRVAAGAVCKLLLSEFGVDFASHAVVIGGITSDPAELSFARIKSLSERSNVRCVEKEASKLMRLEIDRAKDSGDTLGGVFEVIIKGVPPGLGSYTQRDKRLDSSLAGAVMSIPGIKGVEIGAGFGVSFARGSEIHDEIFYDRKKKVFIRKTNRSGGIEGGVSNGENIVLRAAMKPIATLMNPLVSVNIRTKKRTAAQVERSDVCVVPAAGVIAESALSVEIARSFMEKFGGDSLAEVRRNYGGYIRQVRRI